MPKYYTGCTIELRYDCTVAGRQGKILVTYSERVYTEDETCEDVTLDEREAECMKLYQRFTRLE